MTNKRQRRAAQRKDGCPCFACKEEGAKADLNGRVYCGECYRELVLGEITNHNITFLGGGRATKDADDNNPGQSNAIRNMEDNHDDLPRT